MEQKDFKIFNKTIMQSVTSFCDANNIEDKDNFIYLCFKQGFDIKKFGLLGETINEGEKDLKTVEIEEIRVEIEVIREIRVEVPVEVIKEVEKIVEVIKEVEKPNDRLEMIQETLISLRKELQTKNERIKELEKINRDLENLSTNKGAVFLRGSNLNNRI